MGDLPIQEVICRVPEAEQFCPLCGERMELVGKKYVREEIQIIPAMVKRIRYYMEVYACKKCKDEYDEFVTEEAAAPTPLLKHSLASLTSEFFNPQFFRTHDEAAKNRIK